MSADAVSECPRCHERALREYHEMGVDDGVLLVEFRGFCKICDFSFHYSHQEVLS